MTAELIEVLQHSELLTSLPSEVIGQLARTAVVEEYSAGEVIFEVNDPGAMLYIIREGVVEIRRSSQGGLLTTLRAETSFGELAAFDQSEPRSAAAVAITDVVLVGVGRAALVSAFAAHPEALMATVGNMARMVTRAKEQVILINHFLEDKVAERTEEVRETQLEIIRRLGTAAEFRDDETGAHIYRMSHYSRVLARRSGLDEAQAEQLIIAAPMHDVGKIGVPDHILLKPGKLDDEEWDVMRAHTVMGAQMLAGSRSPAIRLAKQIALEHHERWDGRGYPHGLAGENICLEARICSIADVFDALTSTRPYKKPWTFDDALAEVEASSGSMFDPELVVIFVGLEAELREIHRKSEEGTLSPHARGGPTADDD